MPKIAKISLPKNPGIAVWQRTKTKILRTVWLSRTHFIEDYRWVHVKYTANELRLTASKETGTHALHKVLSLTFRRWNMITRKEKRDPRTYLNNLINLKAFKLCFNNHSTFLLFSWMLMKLTPFAPIFQHCWACASALIGLSITYKEGLRFCTRWPYSTYISTDLTD